MDQKCKDTVLNVRDGKMKQNITKYRPNSRSPSVLLELVTSEDYLPIWLAVQSVFCSSGSGRKYNIYPPG